jgi:hypothetical protein
MWLKLKCLLEFFSIWFMLNKYNHNIDIPVFLISIRIYVALRCEFLHNRSGKYEKGKKKK